MTQTEGASTTPDTPPTITINGDNPAIIEVGETYADLGATVTDTGPGQAGDTNLGYQTPYPDRPGKGKGNKKIGGRSYGRPP